MHETGDRTPTARPVPEDAELRGAPGAGPWLRWHLWCSVVLCFGVTLPTTAMELSLIPLGAVCAVGLQHTVRGWAGLVQIGRAHV